MSKLYRFDRKTKKIEGPLSIYELKNDEPFAVNLWRQRANESAYWRGHPGFASLAPAGFVRPRPDFERYDVEVSTSFLGIDHRFSGEGPPVLFETLVFGGRLDGYMIRTCTYDEAKRAHVKVFLGVLSAEGWHEDDVPEEWADLAASVAMGVHPGLGAL